MKLTELFPQFLRMREMTSEEIAESGISGGDGHYYCLEPVDDIALADGIRFTDPVWAAAHPGVDGYWKGGGVMVGFHGRNFGSKISVGADGKPTGWEVSGTGYYDLRLSPSIFVNPQANPPGWHGFIGLNVPGEVTTV